MEFYVVFREGIEIEVTNCGAHGVQFPLQFADIAFQRWGGGSCPQFFQCSPYLISLVHLFWIRRVYGCRELSRKRNHAERLKLS